MTRPDRRGAPGLPEYELPSALRKYQWDGVSFLTTRSEALLADEMGLGKTVQAAVALRLMLSRPNCNKALVVTPTSLRLNWIREIERWAPSLAVRKVAGPVEERMVLYRLPIPVLIVSYEQVRTDVRSLSQDCHFDLVILDEAQRIKNADSATALACRLLPRSLAWALTGTPLENQPRDLLSIFAFLKPRLLNKGLARAELHGRMQPYFLRRKKEQVLPELPPLIVQDLPLELQDRQRAAYLDVWDARLSLAQANGTPVSEAHMLALITKLKQLCNFDEHSGESVKLDALFAILEGLTGPRDKIVVFSQYVETLRWLSHRLRDFPHQIYHGGLSEGDRDGVINRFETEGGPRALLMSLRAGGVGLNLQSASTVVLFDRWWNPAAEDQAVQRAHRFGRDRPLHVIRFLVMDSIEERIMEVLRSKQILFDAYVDSAESAHVSPLARNELRRVLDLTVMDIQVDPNPIQSTAGGLIDGTNR